MSEGEMITVVVGPFDPLLRRGLEVALHEDRDLRVLVSDLEALGLDQLAGREPLAVAILDEDAARLGSVRLGLARLEIGVVVLAHEPSVASGMLLVAGGATCLPRSASAQEVRYAVHLAARGGCMFASRDHGTVELRNRDRERVLTPRETQVLERVSGGDSYAEIALALNIKPETVRKCTLSIRRKLKATSRRELIGMSVPITPGRATQ